MELLYVILSLVAAVLEALVIGKAIKSSRRARLLARLPWSRVGQLQPGLVKVQGQAVATGDALRSPLSQTPCVYFRFQVQEKRTRGPFPPGGAYWKTVIDDAQFAPCTLHDGTGSATLTLKSAELVLQSAANERSGFMDNARPELEATLQQLYGYSSVGLLFNRTLHYRERRIEQGDALIVLGTARKGPGGEWELVGGDGPLLVSNKGLAKLLASYRGEGFLWWCLAVLLPVAGAAAVIGIWG